MRLTLALGLLLDIGIYRLVGIWWLLAVMAACAVGLVVLAWRAQDGSGESESAEV